MQKNYRCEQWNHYVQTNNLYQIELLVLAVLETIQLCANKSVQTHLKIKLPIHYSF